MVRVVLARYAACQLDGLSLSNALGMPAKMREKAQLRATNIVKSLDKALARYDGVFFSVSYRKICRILPEYRNPVEPYRLPHGGDISARAIALRRWLFHRRAGAQGIGSSGTHPRIARVALGCRRSCFSLSQLRLHARSFLNRRSECQLRF